MRGLARAATDYGAATDCGPPPTGAATDIEVNRLGPRRCALAFAINPALGGMTVTQGEVIDQPSQFDQLTVRVRHSLDCSRSPAHAVSPTT